MAKLLPNTDPIHKVTIIPRGRALGLTQQLPMDEKHTYPKDYLMNNICILMGGRVAEEIVLNIQTTGAGNDIEKASDLARRMVCDYGMSDDLINLYSCQIINLAASPSLIFLKDNFTLT